MKKKPQQPQTVTTAATPTTAATAPNSAPAAQNSGADAPITDLDPKEWQMK